VRTSLARLSDAGLLFYKGTPPNAFFVFKHALMQDAAYGTLLRNHRRQLHARIVTILERQFPEIVVASPHRVAQHCAEAGLDQKAVAYWTKAGQQSIARSAMTEAVRQLQKGLALLTQMPESRERQQQELDLYVALGPALIATKGYSATDVGDAITRARELAERLERPDRLIPLLCSQRAFRMVRAEHRLALSHAEEIEKIGAARNDTATRVYGRYVNAIIRFHLGEFLAAREFFERYRGMNDPAHRTVYSGLIAEDPHTVIVRLARADPNVFGLLSRWLRTRSRRVGFGP
jgi:predicted ATPase